RVGRQVGVVGQEGGGLVAGRGDDVLVSEELQQLEGRALARLGGAQDVALAALFEVDRGELETVEGGCDRGEAGASAGDIDVGGDRAAERGKAAPADEAAKGVEPRGVDPDCGRRDRV